DTEHETGTELKGTEMVLINVLQVNPSLGNPPICRSASHARWRGVSPCRSAVAHKLRSTPSGADAATRLAHDQHRQFQRLLVVEARIDMRLVGTTKIRFAQITRATKTLGDIFAGELQMHATQTRPRFAVQIEGLLQLAADIGKMTRLVTVGRVFGVAVHGVAHPQHA